jgi:hypothetical protein
VCGIEIDRLFPRVGTGLTRKGGCTRRFLGRHFLCQQRHILQMTVRSVGVYLCFSLLHQLPIRVLEKCASKCPSDSIAAFRAGTRLWPVRGAILSMSTSQQRASKFSFLICARTPTAKVPGSNNKYGLAWHPYFP